MVEPIPAINESKTPERVRVAALVLGPLIAAIVGYFVNLQNQSATMGWTASITTICAIWWILEPIPIAATSLIPLAVFPLAGVLSVEQTGQAYGDKLILLMLGGFVLSAAMEKSGAHRRIALGMVNLCGGSNAKRLVIGFMAAAALLSMWISNAATTLMLLPIAMAVTAQTENRRLQVVLLIGIAYGASIGGVGTPIGTPPNLVFMKEYAATTNEEPGFLDWMSWALPVVLIMLPIAAFWLTRGIKNVSPIKLPNVGKWRREEVLTLLVFTTTALFWITRKQPFGGWKEWLALPGAEDSSVALLGAITLFLIPSGNKAGEKLMDWETAQKIPWGILVLFAGGICIASAFKSSGLSELIGSSMAGLGSLPILLLVGIICLGVTFLTEVTSNTATTVLLMPILANAAVSMEVDPKLIMVPATISASFAFMLPVATPPNAIVFGSRKFTVKELAREGLLLNLIGVIVVSLYCFLMFGAS